MSKAETLLGGYEAGAAEAGLLFRCARCHEQLTDPASIQHGFGPVCRRLSNDAYAKLITANPQPAIDTLNTLVMCSLPDGVQKDILLALRDEIQEGAASGRHDWRGVVHCLVRLIGISQEWWKAALCEAIRSLGYHVLAEVALEHASPSPAEVSVGPVSTWGQNSAARLIVKCKRNKAANAKFKAIQGRRFESLQKIWHFPVTALKEVIQVVETYFPLTKLNVPELLAQCAAVVKRAGAEPAVSVKVQEGTGKVEIKTPFNPNFISDLKASLPWNSRGWDSVKGVWWVANECADLAVALVSKHFPEQAVAA